MNILVYYTYFSDKQIIKYEFTKFYQKKKTISIKKTLKVHTLKFADQKKRPPLCRYEQIAHSYIKVTFAFALP